MPALLQTELMIAATTPHVEELLEAQAAQMGAPVLSDTAPRSVLKQIALASPSTLVVQVTPETVQSSVGLIQLVSAYRRDVRVIAAATFQDNGIETACRAAGASVYVCISDGSRDLQDALDRVLDGARVSRGFTSAYARNGMQTAAMASAWLLAVMIGLFSMTGQAQAATVIQDGFNGTAYFNFDGTEPGEVAGLYNLERAQVEFPLNGGDPDTSNPLTDVDQQWYWYGVNGGAATSLDQAAVITNGPVTGDSDGDGLHDVVQVLYDDTANGLLFSLTYRIQGVEEFGQSVALERSVRIFNYSNNTVNLNFFDYSDLSLTQARDDVSDGDLEVTNYPDYLQAANANGDVFYQWDYEIQPDGNYEGLTNSSAITVFNLVPDNYEIGLAADVYGKLTGTDPTNLLNNYPDQFGPGDLAFLVNYNFELAPGTGTLYGAQLLIVPEPTTASVFMMGGLVFTIALQSRPRNNKRPASRRYEGNHVLPPAMASAA